MTIVLTTVGSVGDVVPHLALARGLIARGHRVRVASHRFHRPFFEGAGVDFVAVGAPWDKEDFNQLIDEATRLSAPIHQFDLLVRRLFLREPDRQFADLQDAMSDAELVVSQRFDYVGQEAAIARGLPWASVTLTPQLLRTREAPVYPSPSLGRWWTELTWMTVEQMAEPMNRHVAEVLVGLGCDPRPLGLAGASSPFLDLVATSTHLAVARGDWPSTTVMTGAWVPEPEAYTPDPALAGFLERHPKPVLVTFGSMGGSDPRASAEILLSALQRAGKPAIIQHGYSGLMANASLPEDVLAVGHVPHDYLMSRAGCIVHHAGAGTAAAVARSGVPSVPVPHLFDQYYWAGRLHDCGAAPKPLFRNQLSARKLAARIKEASRPKILEGAAALGERVRAEAGVDAAIEHLEALMERISAPP